MEDRILLGVLLLPVAGAVLVGLTGQRAERRLRVNVPVRGIAVACLALSGGLAGLLALGAGGHGGLLRWVGGDWLDVPLQNSRLLVPLALSLDRPRGLAAACGLALAVVLALCGRAGSVRDSLLALCWGAAGCLLLLSDNFALCFAGWAGLGLALDAAWGRGDARWSRQRLSDALFLLAIVLLVATSGTLDFEVLLERAARLGRPRMMGPPTLWGQSAAIVVCAPLAVASWLRVSELGALLGARLFAGARAPVRCWIATAGAGLFALFLVARFLPVFAVVPGLVAVTGVGFVAVPLLTALCAHPVVAGACTRAPALWAALAHGIAELELHGVAGALLHLPPLVGRALDWSATRVWSSRPVRIVFGVLAAGAVGGWLIVPHAGLQAVERVGDMELELVAGAGPGYAYLWDFDSDGAADTAWETQPRARHLFAERELANAVVVVLESGTYGRPPHTALLSPGQVLRFDPVDLGAFWRLRGGNGVPPRIVATDDGVRIRLNGGRARRGAESIPPGTETLELSRGEQLELGTAKLSITGVARPTLYVRNAFGLIRSYREELALPEIKPGPAAELAGAVEAAP